MIESVVFPDSRSIILITTAWLIFAGVALLMHRLRNALWRKDNRNRILERILPYLEMLFALALLLWSGWMVLGRYPVYYAGMTAVVLLALLWSIRFALYDIVSGIVLRSENRFQPGDTIAIDGLDSEINQVGYRSLVITKSNGSCEKIPYSTLSRIPLVKPTVSNTILAHTFTLLVPADAQPSAVHSKLNILALTSPWSVVTEPPDIKLEENSAAGLLFRITVYALEMSHLTEVENRVSKAFDSTESP